MGGDERGDGPVGLARLCEELTALRDSDDSDDDGSSNVVPAPPDGGARLLRDVVEAARCAGRLDDDDDERWVPLSGSSGHATRRRLVASLRELVDACGGRARIADAAAWCDVDASVAERVAETDGGSLLDAGVPVSAARPEERAARLPSDASARRRVRGVARASDAPTTVGGIAAAAGIDDDRSVRRLLAEESRGLGDLGADGRYAPRARAVRRRRAAARALATRGWTADAVGVGVVDAEDVVRTPRGGVVFDRARVLGPLREELRSDGDAAFVDARRRLPEGFWEALADDDEDARFVLTSALPDDDDDGAPPLVAVSDGEALVVSPRAVERVRREIVPPLVEDFAARRAQEKLATTTKDDDDDDDDDDVLSLSTVAAAVAAAYPDEAVSRDDDDRARLFSALVRAVVGPSLASSCRDRVDAAVRRARSRAAPSRDDVAARFEATFADACLWTRACLKGARNTGDDETSRRVASALARRVVARGAHRHDAEAAVSFDPDDDDERFFDPVDLGRTSRGGATRLVADEKTLRDSALPREAAAAVIELWATCGGARTTNTNEKEEEERPPFSSEAFLRCAEENCLILCGLPFKQLDKKSEKRLMSARKQALFQRLDRSKDPRTVLEITVVLLWQQTRNALVVVSDDLVATTEALRGERRIPTAVAARLRALARAVVDGAPPDVVDDLVRDARAFASCKDVSKLRLDSPKSERTET